MSTRDTILVAALKVLENDGASQFSTRAVCALARVTAPTLYHHFGNADGLLSAALAEAFQQFLASKRAAVKSKDPEAALREGWDDYVRFASARPKLYAAMMARVVEGAHIEAATQGNAALRALVQTVADEGKLALSIDAAADLIWASANAASLLYVTAQSRGAPHPKPATINAIRDGAMRTVMSVKARA